MDTFTFGSITYNQEEYILEHLESIKYQVEHYGKEIKCFYVMADDASTDNTVTIARKWIDDNRELFVDVKIIVADVNGGIVKNYLECLNNIESDEFKIMAGDDLYTHNNVFSLFDKGDFIATATMRLKNGNIEFPDIRVLHPFIGGVCAVKQSLYIKKEIPFEMPFVTPAVFVNRKLIDMDVINEIKQYHFIEDRPMFHKIFSKNNINVSYNIKPYVLYRVGSGISTGNKRLVNKIYEKENALIKKRYIWKKNFLIKVLNPWEYIKLIKRIKFILLLRVPKSRVAVIMSSIEKEYDFCNKYYDVIKSNVEKYKKGL